ncbi:MAG TPA: hypothetical protein ENN17_01795 [bacterium]|nr:hypothetical protein [bacterium]
MNRWIAVMLLAAGLTGLLYYGAAGNPWVMLHEALARPDEYDGRVINLFVFPKIERIHADGFDIREANGHPIRVYGDPAGLRAGEYVGLNAVFRKEGYLVALEASVSERRRYKVFLSLFPVAVVGFLFMRTFRFNFRKMQFEARDA